MSVWVINLAGCFWNLMPKIARWDPLPANMRNHLADRMREISVAGLKPKTKN